MTDSYNQENINLAGAGSGLAQRNVGYVDPVSGDDATGEIGTSRAFATIQGFLDAVPQGDDSASARNVFTAQISPGDYDEDLAVDISRKRIVLTGPGSWNLGQFNGVDWGPSGTPRNIVVTGSTPEIDGIRSGLVITNNLPLTEAWTTHESYLTRPRISGQIDLSGIVGLASVELGLTCEIFGNPFGVSINAGAAIIQSYLYHCRMRGSVTGANWNFQQAFYSRFQGLINVSGFSLIDTCRIDAGLTTLSVPPVGIIPGGMINTYFAGTFTGPAGSAKMDGFTNYYFKANGAALAGGATKVITDDLIP